jgi:hypothetical protein
MSQGWWQRGRCGGEGVGQVIWEDENWKRQEGKGGVRRLGAGDDMEKSIETQIDVSTLRINFIVGSDIGNLAHVD